METARPVSAPRQSTAAADPAGQDYLAKLPLFPAPPRTVADLKHKSCWICLADQDDGADHEFVHACVCSLIAHHDCLALWVAEREKVSRAPPKCPACDAKFDILEQRSQLLVVLLKFEKVTRKLALAGAATGAILSVHSLASSYGYWALSQFIGAPMTTALRRQVRPWYGSVLNGVPLIPVTLILSRTARFDAVFPFLPLLLGLGSLQSKKHDILGLSHLTLSWPPSPALTICLIPWFRVAYISLQVRAYRLVGLEQPQWSDALLEDALPVTGEHDEDDFLHPAEITSLSKACSLLVSTLLFPAAAAVAGSLLFYLSTRSRDGRASIWLRHVLGVQGVYSAGLAATLGTSWIQRMASPKIELVDPVWVRTTLGGGLVLLGRDLVQMLTGVLRLRRLRSRRIRSKDFDPNLELDV